MSNQEMNYELKVLCESILNKEISRELLKGYAYSYLNITTINQEKKKKMNTKENNKMIAEFMGLAPNECGVYQTKRGPYHLENLSYHISWDWLMPVVKKCWRIINELDMSFDKVIFKYRFDYIVYADLKESYEAIVEFINEYNKNK